MNAASFVPQRAQPAALSTRPAQDVGAAAATAALAMAQLHDQLVQLAPAPGREEPEGLPQARLLAASAARQAGAAAPSRVGLARSSNAGAALGALALGKALAIKLAKPEMTREKKQELADQERRQEREARARQERLALQARAPKAPSAEDESGDALTPAALGALTLRSGALAAKLRERRPADPAPPKPPPPKLAPFFLTLPT